MKRKTSLIFALWLVLFLSSFLTANSAELKTFEGTVTEFTLTLDKKDKVDGFFIKLKEIDAIFLMPINNEAVTKYDLYTHGGTWQSFKPLDGKKVKISCKQKKKVKDGVVYNVINFDIIN